MNKILLSSFILGMTIQVSASDKPNIILLLIDDMGWSDLGCYAQDDFHETPNINYLAQQGMLFTDAYAACSVSSPTRASIMTGQYPARLRITDWIPGHSIGNDKVICPKIHYELPQDRITVAQALKKQGYHTIHVGKWHLGEREEYWPEHYGFDVNIGGHSKGAPGSYYFPFAKYTPLTDWSNLNLPDNLHDGDYLTDILTDNALQEIEKSVRKEDPFFLNMCYYQVHVPAEGKPEYVEKYRSKLENGHYKGTKNLDYAAMIQSVDESVGRILQKLKDLGIEKETFIILTSDNGGLHNGPFNGNAPLRGGKGTYYEGGIREPFIACWPQRIKEGAISHEIIISTDIYSTLLDVAGASSYGNKITDGISLLPYLEGKESSLKREAVYWHYPHFHAGPPVSVIRKDNYKLIEFLVDGKVELYDLKEDISENKDLALALPDKVKELQTQLHAWKKDVNADELIRRTPETEKYVKNVSQWNGWMGMNNIKNPPVLELDSNRFVTIRTFNSGDIHYTTDGSDPVKSSPVYKSPINMKNGGIVKAKVWSKYKVEPVESEVYSLEVALPGVSVVSVISEDKYYPSTHILDTRPGTYWQSKTPLPQAVVFDLNKIQTLKGFIYHPARRLKTGVINYRTMANNRMGAISRYRIEIGDDLNHMKEVQKGFFSYNRYAFLTRQLVQFKQPVKGRYIRFTALSGIDNSTVVNIENMEFIP